LLAVPVNCQSKGIFKSRTHW